MPQDRDAEPFDHAFALHTVCTGEDGGAEELHDVHAHEMEARNFELAHHLDVIVVEDHEHGVHENDGQVWHEEPREDGAEQAGMK